VRKGLLWIYSQSCSLAAVSAATDITADWGMPEAPGGQPSK
jgi:hypothetical protein